MPKWNRLCLLGVGLLPACSVHLANTTPEEASVFGTRAYPISAEVRRDNAVLANTIKVDVIVGNDRIPMLGLGEGEWKLAYPIACTTSPVSYHFEARWKYLMLFFPIAKEKRWPADSELRASFAPLPRARVEPTELLLYGNTPTSETFRLVSQSISPLRIDGIEMFGAAGCVFGDCTGQNFSLSGLPTSQGFSGAVRSSRFAWD